MNTTIVGMRTLPRVLRGHVQAHPERVWFAFEAPDGEVSTWTYGEFATQVDAVAAGLAGLGVSKGDRVLVALGNRPEFLLAWFGLATLGGVMVPVNPVSSSSELRYILEHSGSVCAVVDGTTAPVVARAADGLPLKMRLVSCDPNGGSALAWESLLTNDGRPGEPAFPTDLCSIMYTSGTTSQPKGVLITHANYVHAGEVMSKHVRLGPDDRHLVVLPLFHGNAQYYSVMASLIAGGSFALMHRFSASRYFTQARRHRCTMGSLFAAPIRMILAHPYDPADRDHQLRCVLYAMNITDEQLDTWQERYGAPLRQLYGMTEILGVPLMHPLEGPVKRHSIGLPTLGCRVKLVDEEGQAVRPGEVGEIAVFGIPGESITSGYLNNPGATARTIRDGWLFTGDAARQDEDGYFYFVDRKKDMVKRAGENVAAQEVEFVINQHAKVFESAVVGVPDPVRDVRIKAVVVLKEGQQATAEEITAFCRERLSPFKVPEMIEFRETLPKTSVGKIQKFMLLGAPAEGRLP